jgi:hypothetical protein
MGANMDNSKKSRNAMGIAGNCLSPLPVSVDG